MALLSIEEPNFVTMKPGNPGWERTEGREGEIHVKEEARKGGAGNLRLLSWTFPDSVPLKRPISKDKFGFNFRK